MAGLTKSVESVMRFKVRIREVFRRVKADHLTFAQYLDAYDREILSHPSYQDLPGWARSEVKGYREGLYDSLESTLEPRWLLDGKLYTDGPEKEAAFSGNWHRAEYAGLYWPGSDVRWHGADGR